MSQGGYGQGGASGFGPSQMFDSLPWKGWRETSTWLLEFVDACGLRLDNLYSRYGSAAARSKLLDPTVTPTDVPSQYLATSIAAGTSAPSSDTMLDVLLFIALGIYPIDSNLSVAQKQALVQVGWSALRRKGTRAQMLNLASKMTDGIVSGWTIPQNFSIVIPDGAPSPGQGVWSPPASTSAIARPWAMNAIRQTVIQPAFVNFGVGYSQFRAGYSAAGEPVFAAGATLNLLKNEHFSSWTGTPDNWTASGSPTQSSGAAQINYEFTAYACVLDQTAAGAGTGISLSQSATLNNALTHRFQLDYKYSNSQNVSNLKVAITDANVDGNTYYWNATAKTWGTSVYYNVAPPSSTRTRYAFDIVPQTRTYTASAHGTKAISVQILATSDGTASTQILYTLYRVGVYESYSLPIETAAYGERTLWLPLVDAPGLATAGRSTTVPVVVPVNASRGAVKVISTTAAAFPYHPALSASGLACHGSWTNLIKGSTDFVTDWTAAGVTRTLAGTLSPIVGETSPTATTASVAGTSFFFSQNTGVVPTSKTYVGGIWVKNLTADTSANNVELRVSSAATSFSVFRSVTAAQGWQFVPLPPVTFGPGDVANLLFKPNFSSASAGASFALWGAYLYDVTGKTGVQYPPVVLSPIGSTSTLAATTCTPLTNNPGANVLSPQMLRQEVSIVRGALGLTIVPMFDASSQPDGVLFDSAQTGTRNRVVLRVASGALELRRWDDSGNVWAASLTLSKAATPGAAAMTWLRDTAIVIRCAWDDVAQQLSAGNGNAVGTKPGSWVAADTNTSIAVGNDYLSANPFSGILTALEVNQSGSPSV